MATFSKETFKATMLKFFCSLISMWQKLQSANGMVDTTFDTNHLLFLSRVLYLIMKQLFKECLIMDRKIWLCEAFLYKVLINLMFFLLYFMTKVSQYAQVNLIKHIVSNLWNITVYYDNLQFFLYHSCWIMCNAVSMVTYCTYQLNAATFQEGSHLA